jgi:hypothetical protein
MAPVIASAANNDSKQLYFALLQCAFCLFRYPLRYGDFHLTFSIDFTC